MLPCNVVLEATDGGTHVRIADPRALIDDQRFADLADDAAAKLRAALSHLSARESG